MINYETILSNYDDRLTLMQWLKKVETALMAAALASVTITQPSDDTAVFNFVFADGTSVSSPSLNLPRGPQGVQGTQGEQGAQGVGVSNVTINSNSHLIVTLTNGVEIDAGYIETGSGIVVDTELSATSTNPVENRVIYNVVTTAQNTITALSGRVTDAETDIETLDESVTNLQTDLTALGGRVTTAEGKITTAEGAITALGGRVTTAEANISNLSGRVTTAEGKITALENDKLEEVTASDVNSEAATSGQVLTADGNGGAAWTTPQGGGGGASIGGGYTFTYDSDMASYVAVFVLCGKVTSTIDPTQDYFGLHRISNYGVYTCENAILFFTDMATSDLSFSVNNCHDATGAVPSSIVAYKPYFLNGNTTLLLRD